MNMRSQFPQTVESLMSHDNRITVLLGDIGVYNFRFAMQKYPDRVYNIGILEQATISMAAGMALTGMIPIVHTIAPFIVERAYEQLKLDFGYQQVGGNFVSVGASYDYAGLGSTHQCPADVPALKCIPEMEIVVPGTAKELDELLRQGYSDGKPTYYRISETCNTTETKAVFGKAAVIKRGSKATIIAVGPMLDRVIEASENRDVTVLYYHTVAPFDSETLKENCPSGKILVCEPYYEGTLEADIRNSFQGASILINSIGVPHKFLTSYGKRSDTEKEIGFTSKDIGAKLEEMIHG